MRVAAGLTPRYLVYAPSCMIATTVFVFAIVREELEDELADLGGSKARVVMAFLAGFVIASGNMLYVCTWCCLPLPPSSHCPESELLPGAG